MVTGIRLPAAQPDLGIEQFRVLLSTVVDALRQRPGCAELAAARFLRCEAGQQVTERALAILRTAGFSPRQERRIWSGRLLHTSDHVGVGSTPALRYACAAKLGWTQSTRNRLPCGRCHQDGFPSSSNPQRH